MRVVAYCYRESTDPRPSNPTPGGYVIDQIDQVYEDWALPADPSYRPQLSQLRQDNQANPADLVLVNRLADLGHTLAEVQECLTALETMGSVVLTGEGPLPPGSRADFWAGLQLAQAIQDGLRRRQLRVGHARNRLKALPPPGKAPYGYRRGQDRYLIDRTAAPVITAFVNEFLLYGSLRRAVRLVESRFGKRISVSTGRRWLTHPVYRGDLQYRDGQILRDTHGAIISRAEAAQIDRLLRRNSQLPPRTAGAPRSLAGLVRCQACGSALRVSQTTRRGQAKTYLYLRPVACAQTPRCNAIAYDTLLGKVINQICHDLPEAVARWGLDQSPDDADPSSSPLATLRQQIHHKESTLAQLPALVAAGILDEETADLRRYKLQGEIAQLEQQIAQLPPVNLQELSQSVSIPQFWLDLSESERRFFFREFIRAIDILRQGKAWAVQLVLVF